MKNTILWAAMAAVSCGMAGCDRGSELLVCGTYTGSGSYGIYSLRFDGGRLEVIDSVAAVNPSYIAVGEGGRMIYAVSENGEQSGVYSIEVDPATGRFGRCDFVPADGADPCYATVVGRQVVTADYSGGSLSFFEMDESGRLLGCTRRDRFEGCGPDARRQASSHVHCAVLSNDGRRLYAADLGADRLYEYSVSDTAVALCNIITLEPGFGPRMVAERGERVYVLGELSGRVAVLERTDSGLRQVQSVVCDSLDERAAGDLHLSADGRFLYGSTRRRGDGIRCFAVDETGRLSNCGFTPTGTHPRNFLLAGDEDYVLVACRDTDSVEVYRRNCTTGALTPTAGGVRVPRAVCLRRL
ncbi:MAG: lactonase family protein [Muribaculaceae bacterium]